MKSGSVLEAIVELAHERGLEQESIIEAIEDAIVGAAYRKYKNYRTIEASFNRQSGEIDLMHYKIVVERVEDPDNEISLDSVKKLDPLAECGDEVEYEIDAKEFSKVIAQTARQLIFQKIREAERESVLEKYTDKKGDIVHGTVSRIERGKVIIVIGNTAEAVLDRYEQIPHEKLQPGDNVRAYLLDLQSEGRGPQLVVSRTHPNFLMKLFEVEVPEVYEGIIDVMAAAREPGKRAKVAVFTNDPDVDPVGACVGPRGSRVQAIVSELCDERIDVVEWSNDLEQFISNALAPADIMRIDLDAEKKVADIQIAQDQLSLAIGKQGQNVRLASKLTGIMINITAWEPGNELKDLEASFSESEGTNQPDETLAATDQPGNQSDGEPGGEVTEELPPEDGKATEPSEVNVSDEVEKDPAEVTGEAGDSAESEKTDPDDQEPISDAESEGTNQPDETLAATDQPGNSSDGEPSGEVTEELPPEDGKATEPSEVNVSDKVEKDPAEATGEADDSAESKKTDPDDQEPISDAEKDSV